MHEYSRRHGVSGNGNQPGVTATEERGGSWWKMEQEMQVGPRVTRGFGAQAAIT